MANVVDGVDNDKLAAWYNDRHAVILAIQRQPGTNTVDVVDGILKLLPEFRHEIPPSVQLDGGSSTLRNPSATPFATWSSRCCSPSASW